ncbi:hypothetical protein JW868_03820 [Candidatus Woesearchaeota archaeon]|nr:hypothetical protein [Candidatus Woesearchaeota archaeon]
MKSLRTLLIVSALAILGACSPYNGSPVNGSRSSLPSSSPELNKELTELTNYLMDSGNRYYQPGGYYEAWVGGYNITYDPRGNEPVLIIINSNFFFRDQGVNGLHHGEDEYFRQGSFLNPSTLPEVPAETEAFSIEYLRALQDIIDTI